MIVDTTRFSGRFFSRVAINLALAACASALIAPATFAQQSRLETLYTFPQILDLGQPSHTFQRQAAFPTAALTQADDGSFYAPAGGSEYGAIYRITPQGLVTTLVNFNDEVNGALPQTSLTLGSDRNLALSKFEWVPSLLL